MDGENIDKKKSYLSPRIPEWERVRRISTSYFFLSRLFLCAGSTALNEKAGNKISIHPSSQSQNDDQLF